MKERKAEWLQVRVTAEEKASIRAAARVLGKKMSGYLLWLHRESEGKRSGR